MTLKEKLGKFYQRNKPALNTLFFCTLLSAATIKVGGIGVEALENYMNSKEYKQKSLQKALEDPDFVAWWDQINREHYGGQSYFENNYGGTGR